MSEVFFAYEDEFEGNEGRFISHCEEESEQYGYDMYI